MLMTSKKIQTAILAVVLVGVAITSSAVPYPTVFPTGTTIYKPSEAYSTYILIADHSSVSNHPSAKVRAEGST